MKPFKPASVSALAAITELSVPVSVTDVARPSVVEFAPRRFAASSAKARVNWPERMPSAVGSSVACSTVKISTPLGETMISAMARSVFNLSRLAAIFAAVSLITSGIPKASRVAWFAR